MDGIVAHHTHHIERTLKLLADASLDERADFGTDGVARSSQTVAELLDGQAQESAGGTGRTVADAGGLIEEGTHIGRHVGRRGYHLGLGIHELASDVEELASAVGATVNLQLNAICIKMMLHHLHLRMDVTVGTKNVGCLIRGIHFVNNSEVRFQLRESSTSLLGVFYHSSMSRLGVIVEIFNISFANGLDRGSSPR